MTSVRGSERGASVSILSFCLLLVASAGLRFYRLGYQSLWADEVVTYLSARGSLAYVLTQHDINSNIPPLYYLIVNASLWVGDHIGFADRDILLRLPSVAFGLLSIPMLLAVLRPLIGQSGARGAAVMMGISPFHLWYSQEARPYALLVLLSLLGVWCLQQALAHPRSLGWRAVVVIAGAALVYCHTIGVAFVVFLAAYVWVETSREGRLSWVVTFLAIGLLLVPAAWRLYALPPVMSANARYSFNPLHVVYGLWSFGTGYSLGPSLTELHGAGTRQVLLHYGPLVGLVLAFIGGLCLWGARGLFQGSITGFRIVMVWFAIPVAFAVLGSMMTVHPFNVRYAILSFPPFLGAMAVGMEGLRARPLRWAAWGILAAVSMVSIYQYFYLGRYQREDNRAGGQFLSLHASPGDLVIASAPYTVDALSYYYPERSSRIIGYPDAGTFVDASRIRTDLAALLGQRARFWLFLSRTYHSDPNGALVAYCDSSFHRGQALEGNGIRVILYTRTQSGRTDP